LPRKVRRGRALDGPAELRVGHGRQLPRQLFGDLPRDGDRASDPALGWALDGRDRPHAEAELLRDHAALLQPRADLVGEERQLVGPHARRHPQEERAILERQGKRTLGDPVSHGVPPQCGRDRLSRTGEAIFAGPVEDLPERLGRRQRDSKTARHRTGQGYQESRRRSGLANRRMFSLFSRWKRIALGG
jgi:hypothetical protein